MNIKRCKTRLC